MLTVTVATRALFVNLPPSASGRATPHDIPKMVQGVGFNVTPPASCFAIRINFLFPQTVLCVHKNPDLSSKTPTPVAVLA